jgi:CheY-like chemotaxis protein
MENSLIIALAEDDEGHAQLVERNLKRAGLVNELIHFEDGQEALDFFFREGPGPHRIPGKCYLLLLDIRMPKVDGIEVLRRLKEHEELMKMPVIMLTTTSDPREVERCYQLGCSNYISKPVEYEKFIEVIRKLGLFIMIVEVPTLNGETEHGSVRRQ